MNFLKKDGVTLAFEDSNSGGAAPIVFIHGWGCNRDFFAPQVAYFCDSHRVISVDLRGHGESDAPQQEYTVAKFADDVAWICNELKLKQIALVGHSMGGTIALDLTARYPALVRSLVIIDSVLFPPKQLTDGLPLFSDLIQKSGYLPILRQTLSELFFLPTDDPKVKEEILSVYDKMPQHVLASSLPTHTIGYDPVFAAQNCHVPTTYIRAEHAPGHTPLGDVEVLASHMPQLTTAKILGAGHFAPLFVPDQINSMLKQFFRLHG